MNTTKKSLLLSIVSLLLCATMLVGTTWAWFTDSVTSTGNRIVSGSLKVDLLHYSDAQWVSLKDNPNHKILDYDLWEPGHTRYERIKVENLGNLALKYQISAQVAAATAVNGQGGERLSDVIDVYVCAGDSTPASFAELQADANWRRTGTLTSFLYGAGFASGSLVPGVAADETVSIAFHMQESAGNEYQNLSVGDIHLTLVATQYTYESDSFGDQYDHDSIFPGNKMNYSYSAPVVTDSQNKTTSDVTVGSPDTVVAKIPAGTKLAPGVSEITVNVTELSNSSAIAVDDGEEARTIDVKVDGLALDNDVPVIVEISEFMPMGLNMGNYTLYHTENNTNVAMTYEANEADLDAHNEFTYDPATGDVKMALKSFSPFCCVAETDFSWKGGVDHTWYMSNKEEKTLYISNADQLYSFAQIVGGMADWYGTIITSESDFNGKNIILTSDINLGCAEDDRNVDSKGNPLVFTPIGYHFTTDAEGNIDNAVRPFRGVFDGQGHTISNFYQNTWEIKGDYNDGYPANSNYYKRAMGLFSWTDGATIKNLTVDHFSSDGEFTPTGVIAAYSYASTFENINITNCNPRVYNTGNGGIVGVLGSTDDTSDDKYVFKNITVDNTNKISALWGSWDVACGGLVGMFRGNGSVHFDNCHVAAQIDAYNDVCGNYQYYWYRYAGMIIGSIRGKNVAYNGYTIPDLTGVSATGCTVHFGSWNNYYYCELVDNSLASYTHDHQFSRLVEVKSVDAENKKVTYLDNTTVDIPKSGRANYVVVDGMHATENATCYHFLNGNVWNHSDAGTETVNNKIVLKEDNQHIYLPFNQVFQGDGWGVKHVVINDFESYEKRFNTTLGIKILDREIANSVDKFVTKVPGLKLTYHDAEKVTDTITIGDLFEAIAKPEVELNSANVYITVEFTNGARITSEDYVLTENANWAERTVKFMNAGQYKITVQDYYYCNPTSVVIDVQPSLIQIETRYSDVPEVPVYYVGYHGNWSDQAPYPTREDAHYDYLLNSVGWRYEMVKPDDELQSGETDENGNPISISKEYWIGTYFNLTGGKFVAIREMLVTSTVQILPNKNPIMFTTSVSMDYSQSGAVNNGKFILNNRGLKNEALWISCEAIFDNITIKRDPKIIDGVPTDYANAIKVTKTGRVVMTEGVELEGTIDLIVDKGGYLWLDTYGFASYTGQGTIIVGANLMSHLQKAEGQAELKSLYTFVDNGGMIVDENGKMLKIYHYGDTDDDGASKYVLSEQNDKIVLDDKTIIDINKGNHSVDYARYAQYSAQNGIITDKNGNKLVVKALKNGQFIITNEIGKVPTLDASGNIDYTGAVYFAPNGIGNGASVDQPIGDLTEALSLIEKNGTLGLANDEYIVGLNSENNEDIVTLYTTFTSNGGKLVDRNGTELVISATNYSTPKHLITNATIAIPEFENGVLTYKKVAYMSHTTGNGSKAEYGFYKVANANSIIGDNRDGYTLVITSDKAMKFVIENEISRLEEYINANGIVVDSNGNAISVVSVGDNKLLVNSKYGVATISGNDVVYKNNLYVSATGTGNGLTESTAMNSYDHAIAILGNIDGRTITVADQTSVTALAKAQNTLSNLLEFRNDGGKLVIGSLDAEIVIFDGQYLIETADGYVQPNGNAEWKISLDLPDTTKFENAYEMLGNNDGTIELNGTLKLSGNFVEPTHAGTITITSGTISTNGATRYYYLNGDTKFDGITFSTTESHGLLMVAQYYAIEIGQNVKCEGFTNSSNGFTQNLTVVGGFAIGSTENNYVTLRNATTSNITIAGGTRVAIIGLNYNYNLADNSKAYSSNINIKGGEIYRTYLANVTSTANVEEIKVNISGGTFTYEISVGANSLSSLVFNITAGNFDECKSIAGVADKSTAYLADEYINDAFTTKLKNFVVQPIQ